MLSLSAYFTLFTLRSPFNFLVAAWFVINAHRHTLSTLIRSGTPSLPHSASKPGCTYSVACANGIPMNEGLNVSVYISIPVPRK